MAIEIDDSAWPLVRVRFDQELSNQEWDRYLEQMSRYPDRREKYVTLTDGRRAATPDAGQRKRASELIAREHERTVRWNVANAVLVASPIIRGVITAIEWASPSPVPLKSFGGPEEAHAWLAERYADATGKGLPALNAGRPAFLRDR